MSSKMEPRIFVGGLSWDTTKHHLEDAFSRFGKVVEAQIMLERDTGRPRGFGFVTFTDQHALEEAITDMHGRELSGRVISVNKAQPKMNSDDTGGYGYGGSGGGGRSYRDNDRPPPPVGNSECFKCGRTGHWARECPSAGGGGKFLSRPQFGGGGDKGARFGSDRDDDRYIDDRYDGGHYGDRDRVDSRDKYDSGRDRYSDRYPTGGDRYSGDRYGGGSDRYPPSNGYGKDRNYERVGGPRGGGGPNNGYGKDWSYERGGGGGDRYRSGGPSRYEGGGSYRERPGPYNRPSRGGSGRPSSYEDRYA